MDRRRDRPHRACGAHARAEAPPDGCAADERAGAADERAGASARLGSRRDRDEADRAARSASTPSAPSERSRSAPSAPAGASDIGLQAAGVTRSPTWGQGETKSCCARPVRRRLHRPHPIDRRHLPRQCADHLQRSRPRPAASRYRDCGGAARASGFSLRQRLDRRHLPGCASQPELDRDRGYVTLSGALTLEAPPAAYSRRWSTPRSSGTGSDSGLSVTTKRSMAGGFFTSTTSPPRPAQRQPHDTHGVSERVARRFGAGLDRRAGGRRPVHRFGGHPVRHPLRRTLTPAQNLVREPHNNDFNYRCI